VTVSSRPLAQRERAGLADLLDALGPDAPTCCAGWTTAHLAAHLVVRERRPDAMAGFGLEKLPLGRPLAAHSHRLEDRLRARTPYGEVVGRLRAGPPAWSPMSWPPVDRVVNTSEFVIHHEDVRRAQPEWTPRVLDRADQDALWGAVGLFARQRPGGAVLRRTDTGDERRVGGGATTLAGEPLELLLWISGRRDVARVTRV
jgi:uncharacterized protein (TIGR03085 family)